MSLFSRFSSLVVVTVIVCAGFFLCWVNHGRAQRIDYVSGLAGRPLAKDANSPTGFTLNQRMLIVPERNEATFDWLAQTQQMLALHEWRIRQVDYDNAPGGREVTTASPYRWCIGLIAWGDHLITGREPGLAVEHTALYVDPLLLGLALIGGTAFVAGRFGATAAILFAIGLASFFPFAAGFLPAVLDQHGLARLFALGGILILLAGWRNFPRSHYWFSTAGVVTGVGLWIDAPTLIPIIAGIFLGGFLAIMCAPKAGTAAATDYFFPPWRVWALSGSATVVVGYLIDYFPSHLASWHLESIHPVYGWAWLGVGELLANAVRWRRSGKFDRTPRALALTLLAFGAIALVPAAMHWTDQQGIFTGDPFSVRLSNQPSGVVAASLWAWLARDGMTAAVCATLLPLLILVAAGWMFFRRPTKPELRARLALTLGPVLVSLGFACQQIGWWGMLDGTLVVLLVTVTADREESRVPLYRGLWLTLAAVCALAGVISLWPDKAVSEKLTLTSSETEELIERDLAHWLAFRSDEKGAVIYAPPLESTTLAFYGGLRSVGTFAHDNRLGFGVTLMIAASNTLDEAQALLQARGVRYVIVPSWDPFFDEFASRYLAKRFAHRANFFIGRLRRWNLPPWLRPVPYQMPEIKGFENQSVLVFELVDDQSPAVAAGRLAEYFVETGRLTEAVAASENLRRFPGDLGALAAQAQVQHARDDANGGAQTLETIRARLAAGGDRFLPWDRRVSLAIVLAQGNQMDPARDQVRRCLTELNEKRLRSLTPGLLYNLQVLSRALDLPIADPHLRQLAFDLLPPELSNRL